MDENRVAGTAPDLGGKAQETFGRATGDTGTAAEGAINQFFKGDGPGPLRAGPRERHGYGASSFERLLRTTIEQQPYTAVASALGIGWLLGRSHRPL